MQYDFSEFFKEYEKLVNNVDTMFERIQSEYPEEVTCELGCCDCCYAMFDLTLVEAIYLNQVFHQNLSEVQKSNIYEKADRADREAYRIKRNMYKEHQKGVPDDKILQEVGRKRIRCPLLTEDNKCLLYTYRPITCRIYGVPMSIQGEVHTCTKSNFVPGKQYPAIYMDQIQQKLLQLSHKMVESIPTQHVKLGEVLVPVSMALLNVYNDEYLGIIKSSTKSDSSHNAVWTVPGPQGDS